MSAAPFYLRFFVLGAQKCATSWLYYCLRDHPGAVLPSGKIEDGYVGGAIFLERGPDWFFARFPDAPSPALHGDVAVDYLLDSAAPRILRSYVEDPRFVILLRHPVDRLVSAYYWSVRRRQLPNLPIDHGIAALLDEAPGFPRRFENPFFDELVRRGFYGAQISAYVREFEPEQFLVVAYSEIKSDAAGVVRRIYAHIGVDPRFTPPSLGVQPKRNSYSRALVALERLSRGVNSVRIIDRTNRLWSRVKPREPGLSLPARQRLVELFEPHVLHAERVLSLLPQKNRPSDDLISSWRAAPRQSVTQ